jgi:hypothetical protein
VEDYNSREPVAAGRPQSQCRVYLRYPGFWDRWPVELGFQRTRVRVVRGREGVRNRSRRPN